MGVEGWTGGLGEWGVGGNGEEWGVGGGRWGEGWWGVGPWHPNPYLKLKHDILRNYQNVSSKCTYIYRES